MRKLIALLLSLMMAFSLVACADPSGSSGDGGGSGNDGGGGDPSGIVKNPDYDPYDPEQYIYRNVFANSPYKDQWDTSRSGADIDDIWDSSVLPDKIPEKPSSVIDVDYTKYVGKLDNKVGYNPPGSLFIDYDYDGDVKPWEYYLVLFTGTIDTFNTLVAGFEENFGCYDDRYDGIGETRFKGELHAYSTDLYIFMTYQEGGSYNSETYDFESDGTVDFSLYAIPAHHQLPKVVEGVPLMQAGYIMWHDTYLMCYGENDYEYTELPYDFQTGTATGTVKEYWGVEFSYYGATTTDADVYGSQLMNAGFTRATNENDPYYKIYEKEDIKVVVQYDDLYKYVMVRVQTEDWY